MFEFLEEMADLGAQGYLRPFTVDEEQSIGNQDTMYRPQEVAGTDDVFQYRP